ncbi:hypothetical protein MCHI_003600 [Candidatus Magnetoovum chiemensis]|nr:hypothetical protein MCHI_003600 [Candidatus Magnetoovum chiemensis]
MLAVILVLGTNIYAAQDELVEEGKEPPVRSSEKAPEKPVPEYFTPSPPFSEGIFPCSQCHASLETNKKRRQLTMYHTEIELIHATKQRWCLDCHNADNRDELRLANGDTVSFEESYNLCAQCHGTIFRDWKVGVHGKRTGYWNGKKEYRLCVHCHNPHSPRFKPKEPMPMPATPGNIDQIEKTISIDADGETLYVPVYKEGGKE